MKSSVQFNDRYKIKTSEFITTLKNNHESQLEDLQKEIIDLVCPHLSVRNCILISSYIENQEIYSYRLGNNKEE